MSEYRLKYTVPFRTISEKACVVQIEVRGYTGVAHELIAGGTPFLIDTDRGDLLTPIRASSATLAVYGSCYLQDLFTSDPQGIRVTLRKEGQIEWIGFMTQDTFSQDFSKPEFIYEIECVSALSTLKHKKFDLEGDFVSFLEIIRRARDLAGYSDLYLTRSVRPVGRPPTVIDGIPVFHLPTSIHSLRISVGNFFDELGEAMTYYEALEEIAKYTGCTFTPYKSDLYLIDYAAIRRGINSYERVVGNNTPPLGLFPLVTLADSRTINEYKGTGTRLSRIAGRNKATVIASLFEVDTTTVTFDDEGSEFQRQYEYTEDLSERRVRPNAWRRWFLRHFRFDPKQSKYTFYRYPVSGNTLLGAQATTEDLKGNEIGSGFVRTANYEDGQFRHGTAKLTFTDEVLVRRYTTNANVGLSIGTLPILTMESDNSIISVPGAFFCVNFEWKILHGSNWWGDTDSEVSGGIMRSGWIHGSLRFGDLYYLPPLGWVEITDERIPPGSIPTFTMRMIPSGGFFGIYHRPLNTNGFENGMPDIAGHLIEVPADRIMAGKCELTLYFIEGRAQGATSAPKYTYFKNIQLSYAMPNKDRVWGDWIDEDSRNDIVYENIIDEAFVDPADTINLKICTAVQGKVAHSFVLDGKEFLTEITSDAFGTDIAEHILLQRVIGLFRSPRFVIDPTLHNDLKPYTMLREQFLPNTTRLMYAGGEEDVKMERVKTNLIEML